MSAPILKGHVPGSQYLVCVNDDSHKILVVKGVTAWLAICVVPGCAPDSLILGSDCWYDEHENLHLLFDWLGDIQHSTAMGILAKPWNWEPEFTAAKHARDHETRTDHKVLKYATDDTSWYCNGPGDGVTECPITWGRDDEVAAS